MSAARRAARAAAAVGLALGWLGTAASAAVACPSCKEALGTSERWQSAFNASVLFMVSMPFAVVAVVAGAIYRAHRRRRGDERSVDLPPAA